MNLDIFKHLFDALKIAPKHLVAILAVMGFLLFAPAQWMEYLSVSDVAKDYRKWIGVAFLTCSALLLVSAVQWIYAIPRTWLRKRRFKRQIRERLGRLTEDEKQILRFYIAKQTRTNSLRPTDGVVQALARAGIIGRVSSNGHLINGFAYNIGEVAWNVLNEDHSLLDGTTNTYRTDKRDDSVW